MDEKREYLFKVLVIGDLGVGKTSVIKRYVHQVFSQQYRATIGVDFALKIINWDDNNLVRLQLWDIAGQERFGNMTRVYYRDAVGVFIVFDLTRVTTFEAVNRWKSDLDNKVTLASGKRIPAVLLGNKCDEMEGDVSSVVDHMNKFCEEKGFDAFYATSAKNNTNVEEAASFLVERILANERHQTSTKPKVPDLVDLEKNPGGSSPSEKSNPCCK